IGLQYRGEDSLAGEDRGINSYFSSEEASVRIFQGRQHCRFNCSFQEAAASGPSSAWNLRPPSDYANSAARMQPAHAVVQGPNIALDLLKRCRPFAVRRVHRPPYAHSWAHAEYSFLSDSETIVPRGA